MKSFSIKILYQNNGLRARFLQPSFLDKKMFYEKGDFL